MFQVSIFAYPTLLWNVENQRVQLKEKKQAVHAHGVFHYKLEVGISKFLAVYRHQKRALKSEFSVTFSSLSH